MATMTKLLRELLDGSDGPMIIDPKVLDAFNLWFENHPDMRTFDPIYKEELLSAFVAGVDYGACKKGK